MVDHAAQQAYLMPRFGVLYISECLSRVAFWRSTEPHQPQQLQRALDRASLYLAGVKFHERHVLRVMHTAAAMLVKDACAATGWASGAAPPQVEQYVLHALTGGAVAPTAQLACVKPEAGTDFQQHQRILVTRIVDVLKRQMLLWLPKFLKHWTGFIELPTMERAPEQLLKMQFHARKQLRALGLQCFTVDAVEQRVNAACQMALMFNASLDTHESSPIDSDVYGPWLQVLL